MTKMTNMGKWERWYSLLDPAQPEPFGDTQTYQLGADLLELCPLVEDWGCGKGWMRKFVPAERYRGIDGSHSPFADEVVDLVSYRSKVPGIFMRHVLEHNYGWADILDNAVASFTGRFVLVLFTPLEPTTREIAFAPDPGVPDLSFAEADLVAHFGPRPYSMVSLETPTQYGVETVFTVEAA